ncbi:MAG: Ig domain-containing protein [Planctomycetota bacterium]|jgi:hypothetical protein
MKPRRSLSLSLLLAGLLAGGALALQAVLAAPGDNFRFLTQSLSDGTADVEYAAVLVTANAGGPIAFGVSSGALPPGLSLDADTGRVSGRPTTDGQYSVTFSADDGLQVVELPVTVTIDPTTGAHGHLTDTTLDQGRVGAAYYDVLLIEDGVGPFVYGSIGLPPGLSLNGSTGQIQGSPTAAGTFYVETCVTDRGDGDFKVVATMPLVVLPAKSDVAISTVLLNNGEVDRPYSDTWTTTGSAASTTFDATGLPDDLVVDSKSGGVTGIPTTPGSFPVTLAAKSKGDTVTATLRMSVAPSPTSDFHWDFLGLPPAASNIPYAGQPPVHVAARGGTTVVHSAVGLPEGILYDAATGEITGTAQDVGVYPVAFTATDESNGEVISLSAGFVVLPPDGGDASDVAANMWVTKQVLRTGHPGRDKWKGQLIYNADRRTGHSFDPSTDRALLSLGSRRIVLEPGDLDEVRPGVLAYKDVEQDGAVVSVKVYPAKQLLKVQTKKDTIPDKLNRTLVNEVVLGGRGFCLLERFRDGRLLVTPGYRSTAFVADKVGLKVGGDGYGTLTLRMRLVVPGLLCEPGTRLRLRVSEGQEVLLSRDLTDLIGVQQVKDGRTNDLGFTLRMVDADGSDENRLSKLKYDSRSGKMGVSFKEVGPLAISADEAHLAVQLTLDEDAYYTTVTVFERAPGKYTTKMPAR